MANFICKQCHWIYDEEKKGILFEDLPDSFMCPICGALKESFKPLPLKEDSPE